MLVKRSRFVDTLRDAASFCRLSSFIEYLDYVHYSKLAFAIACTFRVVVYRKTNSVRLIRVFPLVNEVVLWILPSEHFSTDSKQ